MKQILKLGSTINEMEMELTVSIAESIERKIQPTRRQYLNIYKGYGEEA